MSKAEAKLVEMLHSVDLLPQPHGPCNIILVTTDDVVEIMHQLIAHTMDKLDQAS